MNKCWLPVNIDHRADEIQNLNERLEIMLDEFKDLKRADDEFDGDTETER